MIIYKFFALGKYKEKEKWINEMCLKGYALKHFNFCKYEFDECNIGEYYYSLEFLENLSSNPKDEDLINYFKDQWSIEYVCHSSNWIFFRRERTLGKFDLLSTTISKISYFRNLILFRLKIFFLLVLLSILNICSFSNYNTDKIVSIFILLISIFILLLNIPNIVEYINLKKSDLY